MRVNEGRRRQKTKVCYVCSAGGHLAELLRVRDAFAGDEEVLVTYHSGRGSEPIPGVRTYFVENIGLSARKLARALPTIVRVLLRERPDLIVSTGSEIAVPFFYLAPLLRIKTIYIESWCRVRTPSGTGKLVYPVADRFFVQWEPLLGVYGRKAEYRGRIA